MPIGIDLSVLWNCAQRTHCCWPLSRKRNRPARPSSRISAMTESALAQRPRRFLSRHRGKELEIIERVSGFRGLLHLQQIIFNKALLDAIAHRAAQESINSVFMGCAVNTPLTDWLDHPSRPFRDTNGDCGGVWQGRFVCHGSVAMTGIGAALKRIHLRDG